jgi:hypothetical protein
MSGKFSKLGYGNTNLLNMKQRSSVVVNKTSRDVPHNAFLSRSSLIGRCQLCCLQKHIILMQHLMSTGPVARRQWNDATSAERALGPEITGSLKFLMSSRNFVRPITYSDR